MAFSSPTFLFVFLPAVLVLLLVLRTELRNASLLLASLLFYAWGGPTLVFLLVASIAMNHLFGLWIQREQAAARARLAKGALVAGLCVNLATLLVFKYAGFVVTNITPIFTLFEAAPPSLPHIVQPLGISFLTFKAVSLLIDVYSGRARMLRNPMTTALYLAIFPELVAGPISRFNEIAPRVHDRRITMTTFARGLERFILGLGKKVLIADTIGQVADAVFGLPVDQLGAGLAWLGAVSFALQIYVDFSGYSDMAIGLGLMLGFTFLENFDYPYISRSITEFWRRWHLSLSTWLRDYLFLKIAYATARRLGGRRLLGLKEDLVANIVATLSTMLLAGLWHGSSWHFVVWGGYIGLFLVLERTRFGKTLKRRSAPLQHVYALFVITIGWVIFRAPDLVYAGAYLMAMAGLGAGGTISPLVFVNVEVAVALGAAVVGATGVHVLVPDLWLRPAGAGRPEDGRRLQRWAGSAATALASACILALSLLYVVGGTYHPFIYRQF